MHEVLNQFSSKLVFANNQEELIDFSRAFLLPSPPYIKYHIQLIYSHYDLVSQLLKASSKKLELSLLNDKVSGFSFRLNKCNRTYSGSFFIQESSAKYLYQLHSLCLSTNWNEFVSYLIDHHYPNVVSLYIKQKDLTRELKLFEETYANKYKLLVTELLIKEKRSAQPNNGNSVKIDLKNKFDSLREWTSKTLSQVLDEALEREQFFKKIRFQLLPILDGKINNIPIATCDLTKSGAISFNNLYHTISPLLLKQLEPSLESIIKLFLNRGLKQRDYKPAKPLAIEYDEAIFSDPIRFKSFKDVLYKYPNSSKAVYHANPYFHASIADYKDGSSFDIFISNPQRVMIIPQIQTSVAALERIVSYIFDKYHEGNIIEMP